MNGASRLCWIHLFFKALLWRVPGVNVSNSFLLYEQIIHTYTFIHFNTPVTLASLYKDLHWHGNRYSRKTYPLPTRKMRKILLKRFSILTCNKTCYQGNTDGQAEITDVNHDHITQAEKQNKCFTFDSLILTECELICLKWCTCTFPVKTSNYYFRIFI